MRKVIFWLVMLVFVLAFTACSEVTTDTNAEEETTTKPSVDTEKSTDFFADYLRNNRDYLIVVNEDHPYVFDGTYNTNLQKDLVYMADYDNVARPIEEATQVAFTQMMEDLDENYDIQIDLVSAYRDETEQEMVCDGYYTDLPKGKLEFEDSIGPGYSEHHTGLLVLFAIKKDGKWTMDPTLDGDPEYEVIWENLANYGFIERYPFDKDDITGVDYNPYEIRFVGSTEVAQAIVDSGMCLEEYIYEGDKDNE